ncbi:EKC/KEOPS complex subunit GON7-like [Ovis aries]|uniref:EKC/KEOPS complex subunit GON7-like n=1 Tax=Ovis aries TaxID=9940 RepID=UPI001C2EB1F1|nr:EKC/KEOPS complex subunit GON7-like [Ovis aries]
MTEREQDDNSAGLMSPLLPVSLPLVLITTQHRQAVWNILRTSQTCFAVAKELLQGEYLRLEVQRQQLGVPCEAAWGVTGPFQGLSGVAQMRELVKKLFCSQVQQEAKDRVTVAPDEVFAADDEHDSEDENNTDNRTNSDGPSAKWQNTPS